MITKPTLENREEQPYAAIRTQLPIPFDKFLSPLWAEVHDWLERHGHASHGPAIIRYLTTHMDQKLDLEVGFETETAVAGEPRVRGGSLPAGLYAVLTYTGPYKGKGVFKANVAMIEWAQENHIRWRTTPRNNVDWWDGRVERYLTDPAKETDTKKYRTELVFLVADAK